MVGRSALAEGWAASDSEVVHPAPVNAERAWKRADSRDSPVCISAIDAMRVISSEMKITTNSVNSGSMARLHPKRMTARYHRAGALNTVRTAG